MAQQRLAWSAFRGCVAACSDAKTVSSLRVTRLYDTAAVDMSAPAVTAPVMASRSVAEQLRLLERELCRKRTKTIKDNYVVVAQLKQLVQLLLQQPTALKEIKLVVLKSVLLRLVQYSHIREVREQARMALALLGHAPAYRGRGLRILTIDGGGIRGIMPVIVLQHLEKVCGRPIYELFDYVCGTSTGALLAGMVFIRRMKLSKAEELYRNLSGTIFKKPNLLGLGQFFLNQAFYDSSQLERLIRSDKVSELRMYETSANGITPRVAFLSTLVNQPVVEPVLFTNYQHHPSHHSHYRSMCDIRAWKAIMASTAAPGYFEEVKLGSCILQDGGILTNNPCAVAVHEAKHIWGCDVPLQCVVSLGTGLYGKERRLLDFVEDSSPPRKKSAGSNLSLRDKLTKIIGSATYTEGR